MEEISRLPLIWILVISTLCYTDATRDFRNIGQRIRQSLGRRVSPELLQHLHNATDMAHFMQQFVVQRPNPSQGTPPGGYPEGAPGIGHDDVAFEDMIFTEQGSVDPHGAQVVAGMLAQPDTCSPHPTTVEIPLANDVNVIYWPSCISMDRCGGCCVDDFHECQPVIVTTDMVQVMKLYYPYPGAPNFEYHGVEDKAVDKHLSCECRCRTQPEHCDPVKHEYLPDSCRCRCLNDHLATTCPQNKKWDDETCSCICARTLTCMDDEYLSKTSCMCIEIPPGSDGIDVIPPLNLDPAENPCSGMRCRFGYEPIEIGGTCHCRLASRILSDTRAGSVIGHVPDMERVPDHPQYHPISTTQRPRARRPSRRRRPGFQSFIP